MIIGNYTTFQKDRTEQKNLIDLLPDQAKEMISMYDDWAKKIGVIPWGEIQEIRGKK